MFLDSVDFSGVPFSLSYPPPSLLALSLLSKSRNPLSSCHGGATCNLKYQHKLLKCVRPTPSGPQHGHN